MRNQPTLGKAILEGFNDPSVFKLAERTLKEDLSTIGISKPEELARLTFSKLTENPDQFYSIGAQLALEIFPQWENQNVRELYHDYNWRVERAGSARNALKYIRGRSLLDVGGGPGTFSLEVLRLKNDPEFKIAITDIEDWRNEEARNSPQITYKSHSVGGSLPFADKSLSCASLLYVLHHVESDHEAFLRDLGRCVSDGILIFEDVKVDRTYGEPKLEFESARPLEEDFRALSLEQQTRFIGVVDFVCNHIVSQALQMPVPAVYYEYTELRNKLRRIFPHAVVHAHYHGIYKSKCFPNPEAMYFVDFQGAKL